MSPRKVIPPASRLIDYETAVERFGMSRTWLKGQMREGRLVRYGTTRRRLIDPDELVALLRKAAS